MPSQRYAEYIEQCRLHHATRKTMSGNGVLKYAPQIISMARNVRATTALDYGCGKALYAGPNAKPINPDAPLIEQRTMENALEWTITKYDPAVPAFAAKPTRMFDIVWCTDVLEMVPEEDIECVIAELWEFADRALFVAVSTREPRKRFPNGESTHVTKKPADWWRKKFGALTACAAATRSFAFELEIVE